MSSTELLRAYLTERYPGRVYLPFAALLFLVGVIGLGATPTPSTAASGISLAYGLVLLFRLWDDLADRDADNVRHPHRIMPSARRTLPFVALIAALAVVCVTIIVARGRWMFDLPLLLTLTLTLGGWYQLRGGLRASALVNAHVLLLKYPLIAVVASPPAPRPWPASPADSVPLAALGALYLGLCAREVRDDPVIRAEPVTKWALAMELALLVALQVLTLTTGGLLA